MTESLPSALKQDGLESKVSPFPFTSKGCEAAAFIKNLFSSISLPIPFGKRLFGGIGSHSIKSLLQGCREDYALQVGTTIHHVKTESLVVFEGNQKDSRKTGHTFEREKD